MRLLYSLVFCSLLCLKAAAQNVPSATVVKVPPAAGNTTPVQTTQTDYAATVPLNYIRSFDPQRPYTLETDVADGNRTVEEVRRTTQYFDGLGRPLQTVAWQQSTDKKDVVSVNFYDPFGRSPYSFLPYVAIPANGTDTKATSGSFKYNAFAQQNTFNTTEYSDETFFYGTTRYEASPLNRPVKTFAPGNSWAGSEGATGANSEHAVNIVYDLNEANEVKLWKITNSALTYDANKEITATLNVPTTGTAFYAVNTLSRTITTDEQGVRVVEYKDMDGKVVLKKVQNTKNATLNSPVNWLCTYYVYDDYGLLRFVIPPKAVNWLRVNNWDLTTTEGANVVAELCFRYEYDAKHRMIAKKVPGALWLYTVYDDKDRLVFSQDGNMRAGNQWMTTMYDVLNRPVISGITTTVSTHQTLIGNMANLAYGGGTATVDGVNVNAYPVPSNGTFISQTKTHFDSYSWTTTAYSTDYNTLLQSSASNVYSEQGLATASGLTNGTVTGTEVKVIEDPSNLSTGVWLTTVSFYDDKGRAVQVNTTNYKGGKDITTNLYNWAGQVVSSYAQHDNPEASPRTPVPTKRILTDMSYDHTGKVTQIMKRLYSSNAASGLIQTTRVVQNVYDPIGLLDTKNLGHKRAAGSLSYTNNPAQPIDALQYSYNIRGWLKGINKNYTSSKLSQSMGDSDPWFSMEISYDWGYGTNQFNGNIAGIKWRSKGDDKGRSYGYSYDPANRLQQADFSQWGTVWDNSTMDFTLNNVGYDFNGNIKQLKQTAMKLSTPTVIDDLTYGYTVGASDNRNKLQGVTDAVNDNTSLLGDFKYDGATKQSTDYLYDANGNLTKDNNKKISSITYNYLNLPWVETIAGKGTITYIYDAAGSKIEKRTVEAASAANNNTTISTTTTYLSAFVYQKSTQSGGTNTNTPATLLYFAQEEGRVREISQGTGAPYYNFDYYEKDHLGDVRLVLTDEQKIDNYPTLDFEGAAGSTPVANQDAVWDNKDGNAVDVANTRTARPGGMTAARDGAYVKLTNKDNGAASNRGFGAGKLLKVMSGDVINTSVDYYWQSQTVNNNNADGIGTLTSSLLSVLTGSTDVTSSVKGGASTISSGLGNQTGVATKITTPENSSSTSSYPKAYLHVLFFDERFVFDGSASTILQVGAAGATTALTVAGAAAKRNGYCYIYFSNESNNTVYFDNFQLKDTRGPVVQETHYSPWGLRLQAICSDALGIGGTENRLKYNGKEEQREEWSDGSGLEEYDYGARMQDPQLGMWHNVDPLSEINKKWSPYSYAADNPLRFIDPDGKRFKIFYEDEDGKRRKAIYDYESGEFKDKKGNVAKGDFADKVKKSFDYLKPYDSKKLIESISNDSRTIKIKESDASADNKANSFGRHTIYFDPNKALLIGNMTKQTDFKGNSRMTTEAESSLSPAVILYHEIGHAFDFLFDKDYSSRSRTKAGDYTDEEEKYVITNYESPLQKILGRGTRDNHYGAQDIPRSSPYVDVTDVTHAPMNDEH